MVKKTETTYVSPFAETETKMWDTLNIIKDFYSKHLWNKRAQAYKNYFMYKIDRALKLKDFQTNIKSPVVKMYTDAMWTWLYDNIINFRVIGRDREDQKKADDVKSFLEWGFSASSSRTELMAAVKEALICWPGYLKVWFYNKDKTIKYKKGTKKITKVIKEQYPYVKYVPVFNIFIDPTSKSFKDSPYVFERNIISTSMFSDYYWKYFKDDKKVLNEALSNPNYFSSYDYNKIKHAAFWDETNVKKFFEQNADKSWSWDFDAFTQNYLALDDSSKFVEVIEYRSLDKYVIMVNGKVFYDWPNPLPVPGIPYADIEYNKAPWLAFGSGLGVNLNDIQSITDELLNLQLDNTKFQIAPMFQKIKGSDMFSQWRGTLEYEPFKVVDVNTPDGLKRVELWSPGFEWVNTIQFLLQLSEMSEWVNSYTLWYQNKVERSATWVSALVQAFKSRLLPLVESMNQALSVIAEMRLTTSLIMMDEAIVLRSVGTDGAPSFKDITIEDLLWKYDIEFDAQALKSASREVKRDQLLNLMNTAITWGMDPNTWEYFVDMRELWREILDNFEMPQNLVLSSKQVVKSRSKSQLMQAKADQTVQSHIQQSQPQQMAWGFEEQWQVQVNGEEKMSSGIEAWNPIVQNVAQNVPPEGNLQMEWRLLSKALN